MLGLISDMPHMTAELFYDAVENSLTFCVVWFLARRSITKRVEQEHARLDQEHGITHHEDGSVTHS